MNTILEHLKHRYLDIDLHKPMIDEVERLATFYLYNLSGQIVGYQQYRPEGEKKPQNNPKLGKYYTYRKQPTVSVWGVESLHLSPDAIRVRAKFSVDTDPYYRRHQIRSIKPTSR
jgi:hypothetical protein